MNKKISAWKTYLLKLIKNKWHLYVDDTQFFFCFLNFDGRMLAYDLINSDFKRLLRISEAHQFQSFLVIKIVGAPAGMILRFGSEVRICR